MLAHVGAGLAKQALGANSSNVTITWKSNSFRSGSGIWLQYILDTYTHHTLGNYLNQCNATLMRYETFQFHAMKLFSFTAH